MNKAFLLVICLLLTSFTGCIETDDSDLEPVENVDEIIDETNNAVDETNNTVDETNNTVDETNTTVDDTNNTDDNNPIYFQPETRDELKTAVDEW